MGNAACCDQQTKVGQLKAKNQKFKSNPINEQQKSKIMDSSIISSQLKIVSNEQPPKIEQIKREQPDKISIKHYQHVRHQKESNHSELPIINEQLASRDIHENEQDIVNKSKIVKQPLILLPQLNQNVRKTLDTHNFFQEKFNFQPHLKKYDQDFYQGQLDQHKKYPNGYGYFYKKDASLYIGHFIQGKAQGEGAYIFKDGSYYKGQFKDNCANTKKGLFKFNDFQYEGGFKNNKFYGQGNEKSKTHSFVGQYQDGNKCKGHLKWTDGEQPYEYEGTFNQKNQFHGTGILNEPNGSYKGEFINGIKHGKGIYKYANGLKYIGQYKNGIREGKGTLFNSNNKIAYQGQFYKGLPHGTGDVEDKNGKKLTTSWIQGIDSQCL